ncbi:hypothetical protein N2W52_001912 [Clostridium perfringens]|nr:hypothetical protein [Clostridium perfringens]MDK0982924.1 hypothetical protein [Clostridium perfringens]
MLINLALEGFIIIVFLLVLLAFKNLGTLILVGLIIYLLRITRKRKK